MASPLLEMQGTIAGDMVCPLDEQTLHQTPRPCAASTTLRQAVPMPQSQTAALHQRMADVLSFMNSDMDDSEQSSYGLLPCHLLYDSSSLNTSKNMSVSLVLNKSVKLPSLPSIPESPKQPNSPLSAPAEVTLDDVFEPEAKTTVSDAMSGNSVNQESTAKQSEAKFSISDMSKIEFRDDQISARSSTAESYAQSSHSISPDSNADTSMPSTFSRLFTRHSLDISSFTTPLSVRQDAKATSKTFKKIAIQGVQVQEVGKLKNLENIQNPGCGDQLQALGQGRLVEISDTDLNPKFFYDLGERKEFPSATSQNDDEFIQGGDILAELEKEEELLENDNFVRMPQQMHNDGSNVWQDPLSDMALGSSWGANVNKQDITCPSWFSGGEDDGSRISIGKLIGARTENLGSWDDDCSKVENGPDFGMEEISQPHIDTTDVSASKMSAVPEMPSNVASNEQDVETQPEESKLLARKGNILSDTAVDLLISEVSLNADPSEFAKLLVAAIQNGRKDFREASSALFDSSNQEGVHIRPEIESSLMTGTKEVSSRTMVLPSKKVDKVVQVSFKSDSVQCVPSFQLSLSTPLPSNVSCPMPPTASATSFSVLQPSTTAFLKPFRDDLHDSARPVVMPSEVIVEESCCVGVSVDSSVKVQNSSAEWLEGRVVIQKLTCNAQSWNLDAMPPVLRLHSSLFLEPHAMDHLKVTFVPPKEGRWEASLQLFFRSLSPLSKFTAQNSHLNWSSYPPICLRANAINPNLNVVPDDVLNFGVLPEECLSICHLRLSSNGRAKLPVRLVIEGSPGAGQGFYFPNSNSNASSSGVWSSCVFSCVLSTANFYSAEIPVAFKAQSLSQSGEDTQTVSASLRIELDTPIPLPILSKLLLRAVVGLVKLYTRPEDEIIELRYPSAETRIVMLRNAGSIPLKLELSTMDSEQLTVTPPNVNLPPGEHVNVRLLYRPLDLVDPLESSLQIKVLPGGSTYKIAIRASVQSCQTLTQLSVAVGNKFALHSDRRYLYWGAVDLGQADVQWFTLRNVSASETLYLGLKIKADERCGDRCPFQMVDEITNLGSSVSAAATNSASRKLVSQMSITIHPGGELRVSVYFVPVQAAAYSAKIIIRPRRPAQPSAVSVSPWVKFSIPLHGYGGLAVLNYEGLRSTDLQAPSSLRVPTATGQPVVVASSTDSTIKAVVARIGSEQFCFTVRNCGQRAAFVKIIPSTDSGLLTSLPTLISLEIKPSEFVIAEGNSHAVKVYVRAQCRCDAIFLIVFYGEDILRQRFRSLESPVPAIAEDAFLRGVLRLNEAFPNEIPLMSNVTDPSWPPCQADRNKLFCSLRTTLLMVHPAIQPFGSLQAASQARCLANELDENLDEGFAPLIAEETFADVTLVPRNVPTSPPIKEKSPLWIRSEGLIQLEPTNVIFPRTSCGHSSTFKVTLKNVGYGQNMEVSILKPADPFHVNYTQVVIKPKHYLSLPVMFRPTDVGAFSSTLLLYPNVGPNPLTLAVSLRGEAF